MKSFFVTSALMAILSIVKAQRNDTTVYSGCRLRTDTTHVIGESSVLDSCPQFRNGWVDLSTYFSTHIKYQNIVKKEVRVIVEVIIEKDGKLSQITLARHISNDLDKEALRVINAMPKWKPGTLHGHKVRVRYWVVVPFKSSTKTS